MKKHGIGVLGLALFVLIAILPIGFSLLYGAAYSVGLAGLLSEGEDGRRRYDRFRGRIMFPIHDRRGRVVGFGARTLGDDTPKYLNSPETPVFHKGRELYGLNRVQRLRERTGGVRVALLGGADQLAHARALGLPEVSVQTADGVDRDRLDEVSAFAREVLGDAEVVVTVGAGRLTTALSDAARSEGRPRRMSIATSGSV